MAVSDQLSNADRFFSNDLIGIKASNDVMIRTLFGFNINDQVIDELSTWIRALFTLTVLHKNLFLSPCTSITIAVGASIPWRLQESAKKQCLNENSYYCILVCNKHFFAPNHIKVFIFIKFLISPRKCSEELMTILADWQNSVLSMSFTLYQNKISDQSCILS
jgi:hypothetical protein